MHDLFVCYIHDASSVCIAYSMACHAWLNPTGFLAISALQFHYWRVIPQMNWCGKISVGAETVRGFLFVCVFPFSNYILLFVQAVFYCHLCTLCVILCLMESCARVCLYAFQPFIIKNTNSVQINTSRDYTFFVAKITTVSLYLFISISLTLWFDARTLFFVSTDSCAHFFCLIQLTEHFGLQTNHL